MVRQFQISKCTCRWLLEFATARKRAAPPVTVTGAKRTEHRNRLAVVIDTYHLTLSNFDAQHCRLQHYNIETLTSDSQIPAVGLESGRVCFPGSGQTRLQVDSASILPKTEADSTAQGHASCVTKPWTAGGHYVKRPIMLVGLLVTNCGPCTDSTCPATVQLRGAWLGRSPC